MRNKPIIIILFLILLTNIIILIIYFNRKSSSQKDIVFSNLASETLNINTSVNDLYGTSCPDIKMISSNGDIIDLKKYIGQIIVLRFSLFNEQDYPNLVYLDHIYGLYRNNGLKIIFVKTSGNDNYHIIDKPDLIAPIVNDEGDLRGRFNAYKNDMIFIGRDFKIKLINNRLGNRAIYQQIKDALAIESSEKYESDENSIKTYLKNISFTNIDNETNIDVANINKPGIINFFIAPCFTCTTNRRIELLKEISSSIGEDKEIYLLFGKGNDINLIKKYAQKNNLKNGNIRIGILSAIRNENEIEYFRFSPYELDSRMIVFGKKGKINFIEELRDSSKVNKQFILEKMERN